MDMSFTHLWGTMGALAKAVVIVLGVMSVYSLWVMFERLLVYSRAKRQSLRLLPALTNVLNRGAYNEAIDAAKKFKHSHLAKVVTAGLLEFATSRRDKPRIAAEITVEAARQSMDRTSLITAAEFRENLGVLATVGATAPFVGLFGTVVGIINAFSKMATEGGGLASVSAGIAEALVTTAAGLMVAIPSVWLYNYFQNRVDRFTVEMSNSTSEMAMYFLKETGLTDEVAPLRQAG
jgi:biopolymer transport protein ExbB/biopolymer transport protein TolQ